MPAAEVSDAHRQLRGFPLEASSKLRGCDLVALHVDDVAPNGYAMDRANVRQQKTGKPVRFELTEPARDARRAAMMRRDQERLFYEFRLEDRIPQNHLLRRMNVFVTVALADLHKQLEPHYSEIGVDRSW